MAFDSRPGVTVTVWAAAGEPMASSRMRLSLRVTEPTIVARSMLRPGDVSRRTGDRPASADHPFLTAFFGNFPINSLITARSRATRFSSLFSNSIFASAIPRQMIGPEFGSSASMISVPCG